MAHLAKYSRGAVGQLALHYERGRDTDGVLSSYGNQEIDLSKSHLNYNLAEHQNSTAFDFIRQRTSEVYCLNRSNVNVMCDWVVTAPKEVTPEEQEKFFKESYDFLENRYGKENVISSYVHMDETTPHMHYSFIPITYDEDKERYKVSAKEVTTKSDLKSFHTDLDRRMTKAFGRDIGVLNGATKEGNKTIDELKHDKQLLALVKSDLKDVKKAINADKQLIYGMKYKQATKKIKRLEGDISVYKAFIKKKDLGKEINDFGRQYVKDLNRNRGPER